MKMNYENELRTMNYENELRKIDFVCNDKLTKN